MEQIVKLDSIDYNQFVEDYVKPGKPVVLKKASASWKADIRFTPDFFRENFGDYTTKFKDRVYSMREILDITEKSSPENPAPYPILFDIPVQLPEFLEMLKPIHMNYAFPNWYRSKFIPYGRLGNDMHLFIGGVGNQYSLHKDMYHTNAWITQLYGEKRFIAFPRDQEKLLYPLENGYKSPINVLKPDYEKYPDFGRATPMSVILKPGETMYMPNGIWHTTVGLDHNVSLIFDQLNRHNFKAWRKDAYDYAKEKSRLKAVAAYGFAQTVGTLCKLGESVGYQFK